MTLLDERGINLCTTFLDNPSNSGWDISVWTKVVDCQTMTSIELKTFHVCGFKSFIIVYASKTGTIFINVKIFQWLNTTVWLCTDDILSLVQYQLQRRSPWRSVSFQWQTWLVLITAFALLGLVPYVVHCMMTAFTNPPPPSTFKVAAASFGLLTEILLIKWVFYLSTQPSYLYFLDLKCSWSELRITCQTQLEY